MCQKNIAPSWVNVHMASDTRGHENSQVDMYKMTQGNYKIPFVENEDALAFVDALLTTYDTGLHVRTIYFIL